MWRSAYLVALARTGKADEAVKGAEKLAQAAPRSTELLLQAARCHALAAAGVDGEQKKVRVASALDCLQLATQKDYQDTIALETDPDLRVLAQEPAFQTLLAELKKRSPTAKR